MAERGLRPATIASRYAAAALSSPCRYRPAFEPMRPSSRQPWKAYGVRSARRRHKIQGAGDGDDRQAHRRRDAGRLVEGAPRPRDGDLGFAGAFRKSEVVAPNVEHLDFCYEGVRVTVRRSKTDQERQKADHCVFAVPVRSVPCGCCLNGWTPLASSSSSVLVGAEGRPAGRRQGIAASGFNTAALSTMNLHN
jgi:hypothetical protein